MDSRFDDPSSASTSRRHELRFECLHDPGRGVVVPCDAAGTVDIDSLTERMRNAYLGARAMVGREYCHPVVRIVH